jgi:hypothetical protein
MDERVKKAIEYLLWLDGLPCERRGHKWVLECRLDDYGDCWGD